MRVYNLVKEKKTEENPRCDKIREEAYKKSFSACGNDEISALVSDDFGLMYDAKSLGIKDPWLDKMIEDYELFMHFPCGIL